MAEGYGAVVRIVLGEQHMAVEAVHFGNGENTDAAEGAGSYRQNFTLGDIAGQLGIGSGLEAIEGDLAGSDVALQSTSGEIRLSAFSRFRF